MGWEIISIIIQIRCNLTGLGELYVFIPALRGKHSLLFFFCILVATRCERVRIDIYIYIYFRINFAFAFGRVSRVCVCDTSRFVLVQFLFVPVETECVDMEKHTKNQHISFRCFRRHSEIKNCLYFPRKRSELT